MRISIPEVEINPDQPLQSGTLNRQPFGEALTRLVMSLEGPAVVALTAPWGAGKTTFIRMWEKSLENRCGFIRFDAFRHDYQEDPFIALAGELSAAADKILPPGKSTLAATFRKHAARVGVKVLATGLSSALKHVTGVDPNEVVAAATDAIADEVETCLEKRLTQYAENQKSVVRMRTALTDIAAAVRKKTGGPLIFVIDELDRCRPNYAVELLERAKHLFAVDGVVFVLAIHKAQLEESIRGVFGPTVASHVYLQKFIDLEVTLPMVYKSGVDDSDAQNVVQRLRELYPNAAVDSGVLIEGAVHYQLSTRATERAFVAAMLARHATPEDRIFEPTVAALLAVVKVARPEAYDSLRAGSVTSKSVEKTLLGEEVSKNAFARMDNPIRFLKYDLMSDADRNQVDETHELAFCRRAFFRYNFRAQGFLLRWHLRALEGLLG